MRCLYQNAINSVVFVICVHILPRRKVTTSERKWCLHERADDEKKKLEDVTEVQMKYQKEIEAIVRGMSSPKVMP